MMLHFRAKSIIKLIQYALCFLIAVISITLFYNTIRSTSRESSSIEELAPKTGKHILADGVKVYYQELGPPEGTPVVLIHGTGSWSEIWRTTMVALSKNGFRAIAIDIPPFGFSEKLVGSEQFTTEKQGARLNAVLTELNIQNGVLVGHSVGGRPTLEAILNNQDRINRLVLVDVALGFSADSLIPQFAQNEPGLLIKSIFGLKPLRNVVFRTVGTNPFFTKLQLESFVFNKAAVTPSLVEILQKPLFLQDATISNADWFEYLAITSPHRGLATDFQKFKTIDMPVLIIWGNKDDITPLWQGIYLSTLFQNSTMEIIEDVGHIPYIEDTKKFNEILSKFLNSYPWEKPQEDNLDLSITVQVSNDH